MSNVQSNPYAQLNSTMFMQGIAGAAGDPDASGKASVYLTPEALMLYCQSRLQDIDGQVQKEMAAQQNVTWEQSQIGNLMNEVQALQSTITNSDPSGANGFTTDPGDAQKLESQIASLISEIQQRDPNCPILSQLEQLHDQVMATGTGPVDANGNSVQDSKNTTGPIIPGSGQPIVQGYYNGSTAAAGDPPNGGTAPSGSRADQDGKLGTSELTTFNTTLQNLNNTLNSSAEMGMISIQSQMSQRSTALQLTTNILQSYDDGLAKIVGNIGGR